MLVLSRKIGEQIVIGDNICLNVLRVDGNRVQLGIAAPDQVAILRSELMAKTPTELDLQRPPRRPSS